MDAEQARQEHLAMISEAVGEYFEEVDESRSHPLHGWLAADEPGQVTDVTELFYSVTLMAAKRMQRLGTDESALVTQAKAILAREPKYKRVVSDAAKLMGPESLEFKDLMATLGLL